MAKIGILVFSDLGRSRAIGKSKDLCRKNSFFDSFKYTGFRAVIGEIDRSRHSVEYISRSGIDRVDFVLASLHSYRDVFQLIRDVPASRRSKVIIGGMGVVNVKSFRDHFDVAVFGRAEDQINGILAGDRPANVYDREADPDFRGRYEYRTATRLLPGETNIGCRRSCAFCFYSWTHPLFRPAGDYASGGFYDGSREDDFGALELPKAGHYITALDGYSEDSRRRAGKPISNRAIVEKLRAALEDAAGHVWIKVFQIAGFPWERPVPADFFSEIRETVAAADGRPRKSKVTIVFQTTPFEPDPLTPLEEAEPDFRTDWRSLTSRPSLRAVYVGRRISAYHSLFTESRTSLFKNVFVNRAGVDDRRDLGRLIDPRFERLPVWRQIRELDRSGLLDRFASAGRREWSYLSGPKEAKKDIAKRKYQFAGRIFPDPAGAVA